MRIGWSVEVRANHWVKVNLDEDDLVRLLVEAGVDVGARLRIATNTVHKLLDVECERLLLVKLVFGYGYRGETVDRVRALKTDRAEILAKLAAEFPAPSTQDPLPV